MPVTRSAPGRLALVVLGSHRSGTSATARVLSLAGAALPAKLMEALPGNNPTGFWEPKEIADFDDRVLQALDSRWDDLFGPREAVARAADFSAGTVEEARRLLLANYGDANLIVLKEPRITLIADLWKTALREEGFGLAFVIPVRNPLEVATSLKARDGFTRNRGLLLWTSYMLAAERATRGERRVFLSFDALLADPEAALDRLEHKLGMRLPRRTWESAGEIEQFLRAELKTDAKVPLATLSGALGPVRKLYEHLQAAAEDAPGNEDVPTEVADWFSSLEQTLAPVLRQVAHEGRLQLKAAEAQRAAAEAGLSTAQQERDLALDAQARRESEAQVLLAEVDGLRAHVAQLQVSGEQQTRRLAASLAEAEAERDAARTVSLEAETRAVSSAAHAEALQARVREQAQEHLTVLEQLKGEYRVALTAAESRAADLAAQVAALSGLEARADAMSGEISGLRTELEAAAAAQSHAQAAVSEAERQRDEALRTADARVTVVESALAIARRRSAQAEEVLQERITAAQQETREARLALATAAEARTAEAARLAETHRQEREADAGRWHEERSRYAEEDAALRERLAEVGITAMAAQARARQLEKQVEEALATLERERRRSLFDRLLGRR